MYNSIDIIFEEQDNNCVCLYYSQIIPCENKADNLFDNISVHLYTNKPPGFSDDNTTYGKWNTQSRNISIPDQPSDQLKTDLLPFQKKVPPSDYKKFMKQKSLVITH